MEKFLKLILMMEKLNNILKISRSKISSLLLMKAKCLLLKIMESLN